MTRRTTAVAILVLFGALAPTGSEACGDKFLLPARGLSFDQAYRAQHPGEILIYLPAASPVNGTEFVKVQALLTRAGHHVIFVRDATQIASTLSSKRADVVLTSFPDAGVISAHAATSASAPLILPVLQGATKADLTACRLRYACDLKTSDKPERFVVAVNSAMNSRAKAATQKHGN